MGRVDQFPEQIELRASHNTAVSWLRAKKNVPCDSMGGYCGEHTFRHYIANGASDIERERLFLDSFRENWARVFNQ